MDFLLTPESIAFGIGVVLSILFEVWPPAKAWFDKLTSGQKYLFMGGIGLGIVGAFFAMACASLFGLSEFFTCDTIGAQEAILVWVNYFLGNQTMFGAIHTVNKIRS